MNLGTCSCRLTRMPSINRVVKGRADHPIDGLLALRLLIPTLLFLTTVALGANASGRWKGSLEFEGDDGQIQTVSAYADLKRQGSSVTGKIWKEQGQQFEIEQGQVTDNRISFKFHAPEGEEEHVIVHSVRLTLVSPTQLQGTLEFELVDQRVSAKLTLNKEP